MSRMQKVLLGIALSAVLLCSAGALYGYYRVWPGWQEHISKDVEDEIAGAIASSIGPKSAALSGPPDELLVYAQDLDFNSYTDDSGESGFDVSNGEVTIYNSVVTIDPAGIDVYLADMHVHAVPVVTAGRLDLVDFESGRSLAGKLLDAEAIERGIERGINSALEQAPEAPHDVVAHDGYLEFQFGAAPGNPLCGAGGLGCSSPTPLVAGRVRTTSE